MKRAFRLATVERLREARLEEAGQALQQAADSLRAAVVHRDHLTAVLLRPPSSTTATPAELSTAAAHRDRLRVERAEAAEEVDRRTEGLAQARQAWLAARADLKAVQSLHDTHRRALAAADAQREQRALDETAGITAARRMLQGGLA